MPYEVSCSYCGHTQIYKPRNKKIPKKPHTKCKKCGKEFSIDISTSEDVPKIPNLPKQKILKKTHDQKAIFDTSLFIDDPDELLMSVAVRELNKPKPDPRWASILINCRKENISIKSEVIDQLQKLPTKALTEMLKKQSGKSLLVE